MTDSSKRLIWLDWAKAIGIWLVVLGHLPFSYGSVIFYFHMPFFFILSGYLYKPVGIKNELGKTARNLLAPYIMYNMVLYLIWIVPGNLSVNDGINILLGNQELLPYSFRALWFLISLTLIRYAYCFVKRTLDVYIVGFISAIAFYTVTRFGNIPNNYDILQIETSLLCAPFLGVGYLLSKYCVVKCDYNFKNLLMWCTVLIVSLVLAWLNSKSIPINVFRCTYGNSLLLFYFSSAGISISIISILAMIIHKRIQFVEDISKGTLLIIAFHQSIIVLLGKFVTYNNVNTLCFSILITLVFGVLIHFTKDKYPILIGRFKK